MRVRLLFTNYSLKFFFRVNACKWNINIFCNIYQD